jgi:integrase
MNFQRKSSAAPVLAKIALPVRASVKLTGLVERAVTYAKSTNSARTLETYARDFAKFAAWAKTEGLPSLPTSPEVVAVYLAAMADGAVRVDWKARGGHPHTSARPKKYATIQLAYSAIVATHVAAGHEWPHAHPLIVRVMRGIRREIGTTQAKVSALSVANLHAMLVACSSDLAGARNRALLSIGFFAALRRSELVALDVSDVREEPRGLVVRIRESKSDQTAIGEDIALPPMKDRIVCPVRLFKAWLVASKIKTGPLFRRIDKGGNLGVHALASQSVGLLVKRLAEEVGLDPETFSGHSLRAGFVTSAAASGKSLKNIMRQTRHKSERVAMGYMRPATLFTDNAADGLA